MALSQRHRASLFTTLTPLVGEEEAEALLAEFPSHDLDVPATKDFVRAEIGGLRADFGELRADFVDLRAELTAMELRISEKLRLQMVWLTGLVIAAIGLVAALT